MAQQGSPPPRPSRLSAPSRRGSWAADTYPWDQQDSGSEEEHPPWAGPDVAPRWAGGDSRGRRGRPADPGQPMGPAEGATDGGEGRGRRRRDPGQAEPRHTTPGFRSHFARARARRTRRMTYIWGGALVAAVAIVVVVTVLELGGHGKPKPSLPALVTTYQPGEFKTVPTACRSVSSATLSSYLPGHRHVVAPRPLDGRAQSLCNWTVDAPPVYRVLGVTVQAYPPSGLASGNGSATANAKDAYAAALKQKVSPPKATHLPRASVTQLPALAGGGFAALQVVTSRGDTNDLMTVVARDHNVLVTAVLQGLAKSPGGKYGPVSSLTLKAGATAAVRDILAQLH